MCAADEFVAEWNGRKLAARYYAGQTASSSLRRTQHQWGIRTGVCHAGLCKCVHTCNMQPTSVCAYWSSCCPRGLNVTACGNQGEKRSLDKSLGTSLVRANHKHPENCSPQQLQPQLYNICTHATDVRTCSVHVGPPHQPQPMMSCVISCSMVACTARKYSCEK